ncbi:MAG TPA: hypothetical protein ENI76_09790, partial [Ignavibacteria bacterium]|nr:hypothetical protein [Ignavibacteria bacterium]
MCHKTLYDILEISKYSSIEEIKKAYKCLALRYHPDRNTDESSQKMFVEITDAYNVLSDHEKKWEYDIYIGLGIDYELIHSQFDESIHDHFSEYEMPQGWQHDEIPGTDTNVELLITLEESASGCIKDVITISDINITCTECNGLRHATGSRNIPCIVCCGSGKVINLNKKPSVIEIMCP